MFTYGWGAVTDAAHEQRMKQNALSLPEEQREWYLKSTLARYPKRIRVIDVPSELPSPASAETSIVNRLTTTYRPWL